MFPTPRSSTLFPYTTLFRSERGLYRAPPHLLRDARQLLLRRLFQARGDPFRVGFPHRSEEHTSELQSRFDIVCRLLLEKKKRWSNSTAAATIGWESFYFRPS